MSDTAADDAFDAAFNIEAVNQAMRNAGCIRCPAVHDEHECPICLDLGWIDANGAPCEP